MNIDEKTVPDGITPPIMRDFLWQEPKDID
jgi:hypothetical protein